MPSSACHIVPLFWIKKESISVLLDGLAKLRDAGIYECILEARPYPRYLQKSWFDLLKKLLEEAERTGMHCWLFDDGHFPSGYGGGKISSEHQKRLLCCRVIELVGPGRYRLDVPLGKGETLFKSIFAPYMKPDGLDGARAKDVTSKVKRNKLIITVPEGRFRVFFMIRTIHGGEEYTQKWVNMLSPEAVSEFIEVIFERHYQELRPFFKSGTILGFFSDEPRFGSLPTYDSLPNGASDRLPFSEELVQELSNQPAAFWPSLFHEAGENTPIWRTRFMDTVSSLYSKSFPQQIGAWCREHHVEYIGHTVEDNGAHSRLGYGVGHFFRAMHGQSAAMVDSVLHQNLPGITEGFHETSFGRYDSAFYHWGLGKLASSAAHLMPEFHGRSMCECFGANGWSCGLEWMKRLTDHFAVRGINAFVPHAFSNAPFPDQDCPPHFYANGKNPQWPYFHLWREYCDRVCTFLSGGIHLAGTLILYHAEAEWSGKGFTPFHIPGGELMKRQLDFDVVPLDLLKKATVKKGILSLNGEDFQLLIVPEHQHQDCQEMLTLARLRKEGLKIVSDKDAVKAAEAVQPYPIKSDSQFLSVYRMKIGKEVRIFLVNEHLAESARFQVCFPGKYWYSAITDRCYQWSDHGTLAPGESLFLICGEPAQKNLPELLTGKAKIFPARMEGKGEYRSCKLEKLPCPGQRIYLDCGMPDGVVEIEWNGKTLPACIAPPYEFDITAYLQLNNSFRMHCIPTVDPGKGGIFDRCLAHRINGSEYPQLIIRDEMKKIREPLKIQTNGFAGQCGKRRKRVI